MPNYERRLWTPNWKKVVALKAKLWRDGGFERQTEKNGGFERPNWEEIVALNVETEKDNSKRRTEKDDSERRN